MSPVATTPAIDLDLPADFCEVPLEVALEDRVHAQTMLLDRLGVDGARREGLGWYLEALSRGASDEGVLATAFCAVRLGGAASTATLTVSTHEAEADDPLVLALGAAESLRRTGRYDRVRADRLGHTVGAIGWSSTSGTRSITCVVGLPGHRLAVVLGLTTPDVAHVDLYERVLRRAAGSARVVSG